MDVVATDLISFMLKIMERAGIGKQQQRPVPETDLISQIKLGGYRFSTPITRAVTGCQLKPVQSEKCVATKQKNDSLLSVAEATLGSNTLGLSYMSQNLET